MPNHRSLPWKTFPGFPTSAFSPETAQRLAEQHNFPVKSVRALGRKLSAMMTEPVYEPDERQRKVQQKAGEQRRERARRCLEEAEKALQAAVGEMSPLTDRTAGLGAIDPCPSRWIVRLDRIAADLAGLRFVLEASAMLKHDVADPTARNRRLERDDVRIHVNNLLFSFWLEQGRALTLSNRYDRDEDRITGPLADFVIDVVAALTEPSVILKAETLKADLRRAKVQLDKLDAGQPIVLSKRL